MRAGAVVVLVVAFAFARPARAFEDYEGTRAAGMGGATRAFALGDSAVLLNPSGMSLAKVFNLEASYGHESRRGANLFHASIVDSTSATTVSGGLYYTYRSDKGAAGVAGHGHEAGLALSMPIGNFVAVGATGKWFRLSGADQGPSLAKGGFTLDAGVTARPTPRLSVGLVGANLVDLHTSHAPQLVSYGAAFLPIQDLVVALDGVTALTRDELTGLRGTGVRGGAELALAGRFAVRAGGGTDAARGVGYLAAGAAAISEAGAIDVGFRGDLWKLDGVASRSWFLGVSLRLFIGAASADPTGAPPDMTPPTQ
jgi:hypothetical protein